MSEALENRRSDRLRKQEDIKYFEMQSRSQRKRHMSTDSRASVDSKYQLKNGYL